MLLEGGLGSFKSAYSESARNPYELIPGRAFGELFLIVILAFSGFCPDFGGRRGLLWSSFAAWSLSELVNAEFGQKNI